MRVVLLLVDADEDCVVVDDDENQSSWGTRWK